MVAMGQKLHQERGFQMRPMAMAIAVEIVHIITKTAPIFSTSPQAIISLEVSNPIISVKTNHLNHVFLNTESIFFLRLNLDRNRSWKAPIAQIHPQ